MFRSLVWHPYSSLHTFLLFSLELKASSKGVEISSFHSNSKSVSFHISMFCGKKSSLYSSFALRDISSGLLQETTNNISTASILLIDECSDILSNNPSEHWTYLWIYHRRLNHLSPFYVLCGKHLTHWKILDQCYFLK